MKLDVATILPLIIFAMIPLLAVIILVFSRRRRKKNMSSVGEAFGAVKAYGGIAPDTHDSLDQQHQGAVNASQLDRVPSADAQESVESSNPSTSPLNLGLDSKKT